jgi:hypothetical protein
MKKTIFLIAIFIGVFTSCKTKYTYPKFDYNNGPNSCFNAFKDRIFFAILKESYKGTAAFKEISKRDVFNPYDGLPFELESKIDSIAKGFVTKLPRPSMCDDCLTDQNYFMAQALHYYRSSDLDSIAKATFKKFDPENPCGLK